MLRPLWAVLITVLIATGCKKDSPILPEPEIVIADPTIPVSEFTQLKTGNYWIYAKYTIDTNGVETDLNSQDSMYVSGDTVIDNITYSILKRTNWLVNKTQYLRDSADYLIDQNRMRWFSSTDFSSILQSRVAPFFGTIIHRMEDKGLSVTIPAGTFSSYNFKGTYDLLPPFDQWGKFRYTNKHYVAGVGVVKDSYILSGSPLVYEARLIKYNLN